VWNSTSSGPLKELLGRTESWVVLAQETHVEGESQLALERYASAKGWAHAVGAACVRMVEGARPRREAWRCS